MAGILETLGKPIKGYKAFSKHSDWYDNTLPGLLSTKHPELGTFRLTGSPRDTAAEYAGALDWARKSPFGANTDILLAKIYQFLNHGTTKAAKDNLRQDIAAIVYGKGKDLSDQEIIDLAAKYASENFYGSGPVNENPELLQENDLSLYSGGGLASASPKEGGLAYRDYPHPYQTSKDDGGGLRLHTNPKTGAYEGQALPKYTGWQGEISMPGGGKMTEYSADDERGMYPLITPYATKEDIENFKRGVVTKEARGRALKWRAEREASGLTAFKNPEGFAMGGLACITEPRINRL